MSNQFPDVMVDIETTGLNQGSNAIIQIAAVRFNLAERTIDCDSMFDRCLALPPTRFWDENTRNWWLKDKREILTSIHQRMEDPQEVLRALYDWAGRDLVMWGKPTHFDHSFLSSYYQEFGPQMPFHFRKANDMNTFIRSRHWPNVPVDFESMLPFEGPVHNALFDSLHQINVLFHHVDYCEGKGKYANVIDAAG